MGNLPPGTGPVGLVGIEPPVELPDEWPAMSATDEKNNAMVKTIGLSN